jgi:tetratricopeptide (TPR) repeat protein
MRPVTRALAAILAATAVPAAAAAQPSDPEAWLAVRSASFTVYSDAEAERAVEIAGGLERLRDAFALLAPEVSLSSPVPNRIVAFRDAESFAGYQSVPDRDGVKILGQFLAHRDGNFIALNADPGLVGALATIQHEYVHQLVQHNLPRVPLWFNEGLAEYYSTFAVEGETAFVGRPVERHLRWLRGHPRFSLAEVLGATRETAAEHGAEAAGQLYAVSWLLVHYLLSGDTDRLDAAAELLYLLASGEEPEAALAVALEADAAELTERLRDYALQPLARAGWRLAGGDGVQPVVAPVAAADLLSHLGDLLARQQKLDAAGRHYDLALAYDGFHAGAHSGLAAVRDLEGRLEEAAILHREAIALEPSVAEPYLRFGRHLIGVAQSGLPDPDAAAAMAAEARAMFDAAAQLAPGFAECRAMLGAAQLLPGGDRERGIGLLEEVRHELPQRPDVVFNLLQLYLADDRIAPALALLGGPLTRLADAETVARAREAVERASFLKAAREALADGQVGEGLRLLDRALEVTSDDDVRAAIAAQRAAIERRAGRR